MFHRHFLSSPPVAHPNRTLTYQLSDPRTAKEFAPCWDAARKNWTELSSVKIWFNERGKQPAQPGCPLGCPLDVGGGTYGNLSVGFGSGGFTDKGPAQRKHIGPEYGFGARLSAGPRRRRSSSPAAASCHRNRALSALTMQCAGFAINDALQEPVLIIKTAWGGKALCGDFLPPSSARGSNNTVGFYYNQVGTKWQLRARRQERTSIDRLHHGSMACALHTLTRCRC